MSIIEARVDRRLVSDGVDLAFQTPLLIGSVPPTRLTIDPTLDEPFLDFNFGSETSPDPDIWRVVRYQPVDVPEVHRRDYATGRNATIRQLKIDDLNVTPAQPLVDLGFTRHAVVIGLVFAAMAGQWNALTAASTPESTRSVERPAKVRGTSQAWHAFDELSNWLGFSHAETSKLLGLGDKTAYGWRREGHEPQPRLARRLYQAHALVRQLVLAVGQPEAIALLSRDGDESALALIAENHVSDAEAKFADLVYGRSITPTSVMGVSRTGDDDIPTPDATPIVRAKGGTKRVRAKRGR